MLRMTLNTLVVPAAEWDYPRCALAFRDATILAPALLKALLFGWGLAHRVTGFVFAWHVHQLAQFIHNSNICFSNCLSLLEPKG